MDQEAAPVRQGLFFYTVTPCRVIDTREPALGGPNPLAAGSLTTFQIAGHCDVPATAQAVAYNVTVTQPTWRGNLRIYPTGAIEPLVSVINYTEGRTRANNGLVGLGASGDVAVRVNQGSGSVHMIVDVNGYYALDAERAYITRQ